MAADPTEVQQGLNDDEDEITLFNSMVWPCSSPGVRVLPPSALKEIMVEEWFSDPLEVGLTGYKSGLFPMLDEEIPFNVRRSYVDLKSSHTRGVYPEAGARSSMMLKCEFVCSTHHLRGPLYGRPVDPSLLDTQDTNNSIENEILSLSADVTKYIEEVLFSIAQNADCLMAFSLDGLLYIFVY